MYKASKTAVLYCGPVSRIRQIGKLSLHYYCHLSHPWADLTRSCTWIKLHLRRSLTPTYPTPPPPACTPIPSPCPPSPLASLYLFQTAMKGLFVSDKRTLAKLRLFLSQRWRARLPRKARHHGLCFDLDKEFFWPARMRFFVVSNMTQAKQIQASVQHRLHTRLAQSRFPMSCSCVCCADIYCVDGGGGTHFLLAIVL